MISGPAFHDTAKKGSGARSRTPIVRMSSGTFGALGDHSGLAAKVNHSPMSTGFVPSGREEQTWAQSWAKGVLNHPYDQAPEPTLF